jgi:ABC-2 type transport system ATP-binding protein
MDISVTSLTYRYDDRRDDGPAALEDVSFHVEAGTITGVLGRNGSGKTTLLSVLANLLPVTEGHVLVDGRPVFEDPVTAAATCLVRAGGGYPDDAATGWFELAAKLRPGFDLDRAHEILSRFGVPDDRSVKRLSTGQTSAASIAYAFACRAPLTMLDEVHLGLDAPSRYRFYDLLLEEQESHPRTWLLSTHLIEEAGRLFEDVMILEGGRRLLHESADDLRARGATFTGPAGVVDELTADLQVVAREQLGPTVSTTVVGEVDPARRRQARERGAELTGVPLQDLFVHLTGATEEARR